MKRFSVFTVTLFCLPFFFSATVLADPLTFRITDLGVGVARGINDNGQVVGNFAIGCGCLAGVWSRSTGAFALTMDYEFGRGDSAQAWDINNAGQIVGRVEIHESGRYAALWTNPNSLTVLQAGYQGTSAFAINRSGLIVGSGGVSRYDFPVVWQNGGGSELPLLGLSEAAGPHGSAQDVNDAGIIVGGSSIPDGPGRHAVYWENGTVHDLDPLSDGYAFAINNNGAIVGQGGSGAFLWTLSEGMRSLGSFSPTAINDSSWVIGNSDAPFLWRPEQGMTDLNSLVDLTNSSFSSLTYAADINSLGDIVGYGFAKDGSTHAFLLSPVPEAQMWLFLFAGLAFIGVAAATHRHHD